MIEFKEFREFTLLNRKKQLIEFSQRYYEGEPIIPDIVSLLVL